MATDYDAPRKREDDAETDSLEEVQAAVANRGAQQPDIDIDDATAAESFELPGADLSHVELTVEVTPQQAGEFMCNGCFLVLHRAALADPDAGLCRDCA